MVTSAQYDNALREKFRDASRDVHEENGVLRISKQLDFYNPVTGEISPRVQAPGSHPM